MALHRSRIIRPQMITVDATGNHNRDLLNKKNETSALFFKLDNKAQSVKSAFETAFNWPRRGAWKWPSLSDPFP